MADNYTVLDSAAATKTFKATDHGGTLTPTNEDESYASIIDSTTTAGTIYFCDALPGAATSAASWRCSKLVSATGIVTWADGNANFDNVADNRASLSYS